MEKGSLYNLKYPDNLISCIFQLVKATAPAFFEEMSPGYEKRTEEALKYLTDSERECIISHYKDRRTYTSLGTYAHKLCSQAVAKLRRPYISNMITGRLADSPMATLDCLNLSVRTYNALGRIGCKYIEDVLRILPRWNDKGVKVCSNKILTAPHTGEWVYNEVVEELHRHDLLRESDYRLMKAESKNAEQ